MFPNTACLAALLTTCLSRWVKPTFRAPPLHRSAAVRLGPAALVLALSWPLGGSPVDAGSVSGTRSALLLFAQFHGEQPGWAQLPDWQADVFDPDLAGSFTHFYDTMSFGQLRVQGEVAGRVYASSSPASTYLSSDPTAYGQFARFAREILTQADRDIDFSLYDNDGPDGEPSSGDDDGYVDAVFLVLSSAPSGFFLGNATGIGHLGFEEDLVTNDTDGDGARVRIDPSLGTLQRGRNLAKAVGALAHEYGHLLGLPDLYDTDYLYLKDAPPEQDSAGIGRWGLMGWGAHGWHGTDGPNSLCAWSRMHLGWARVTEISHVEEALHLPHVGLAGDVYRIPLAAREYYLLEYRKRTSTHYDRYIPGEGLLIWHVKESVLPELPDVALAERIRARWSAASVDLVCADGRWEDAGYPLGTRPAPGHGGDNLDFWAHDAAYAEAHAGNLGDATDSFDGERFDAFTPDTNPSSRRSGWQEGLRIDGITVHADQVTARVRVEPPRLAIADLTLLDTNGDGLLSPREEATVGFRVVNSGGLAAPEVRVRLTTESDLLQVLHGEAGFGDIAPGHGSGPTVSAGGFPRVRLSGEPTGFRRVPATLAVLAGEDTLCRQEFEIDALFSCRLTGRVVDETGRGVGGVSVQAYPNETESAVDGSFALDVQPGVVYLFVTPPAGSRLVERLLQLEISGPTDMDIVLQEGFRVSGVVRNADGDPVSAAHIFMGSYALGVSGNTSTASDGTYTLMLPRGTYSVSVSRRDVPPHLAFPSQSFGPIRVEGAQRVDLRLGAGVDVTVRLVNDSGNAVGPAKLYLWGNRASANPELGLNGETTVKLLPGAYTAGCREVAGPYACGDMPLVSIASDTTIVLQAPRGGTLSGRVVDPSAAPFYDGLLSFAPLEQGTYTTKSIEADATYAAHLAAGAYEVAFHADVPGDSPSQSLGIVDVPGDRTLDLSLQPGVPFEGRLAGWESDSLTQADIQAVAVDGTVYGSAPLAADARFALSLHPGRYRLFLRRSGNGYLRLGEVDFAPRAPLEVELPRVGLVRGRVVDASGSPVRRALVAVMHDPLQPTYEYRQAYGFDAAALTELDGTYELTVPAGRYCLSVLPTSVTGSGVFCRDVVVQADGVRTLDVELPAVRSLHSVVGQVLREPGTPRAHMELRFVDESAGTVLQEGTRPGSSYRTELPAGRYRVRAGLCGAVAGFRKVYDLGVLRVEDDMRWDIDLSAAPTAVAEQAIATPECFALEPNYPNPFNASTVIPYRLTGATPVELAIYNLLGQQVRRLVQAAQPAGEHRVVWDGRDERGRSLSTGVYLYQLRAGRAQITRKLLLVK